MITQDQFVQNVEKIATRLVLLDSEDTDELQQIVSMFDLLLDWSRQNSQPALEHALVLFSDFSVNHFTTNAPTRERFIALIEEFVAAVQTHGRNDFDFSSCHFPSVLTKRSQEHEPLSIEHSESIPSSPLRNLRHPGVLPSHLDMDLFAEFLALQSEVLDKMEALCLRIEQDNNPDDIAELKRMIHTKKGEAGFLNLADIESLCHVTEDLIVHASFNDHRDILFQMIDWIRNAYIWYKGESENPPDDVSGLIEMISRLTSIPTDPVGQDVSSVDQASDHKSLLYIRHLIRSIEIEQTLSGEDCQTFPSSNARMMLCKVCGLFEMVGLDDRAPELFKKINGFLLSESKQDSPIGEFIYFVDALKIISDTLEKQSKSITLPEKKTDEQTIRRPASVEPIVPDRSITNATVLQKSDTAKSYQPLHVMKDSILVDTERLDRIIDMIGELVISESVILQSDEIKAIHSQELIRHLMQMDKITKSLQEAGHTLRMVPIKSLFQKMVRLVRDVSKKHGKSVQCIMHGEDTELDKTIIDKIGEPLLHIIRNAVDHGIENAEERTASGKEAVGTVILKAFHKGGNIIIEIQDDGRGLNRRRIKDKAREMGLVTDETVPGDRDLTRLIFEDGFSTASQITDISGRGVGMNVVKKTVESLHGQIDLVSSEGEGSTFIIKIPLTLAVIDGMVVRSGRDRFIIPTLSVIATLKINREDVISLAGTSHMVNVHGNLMPLHHISSLLGLDGADSVNGEHLTIVIEGNHQKMAVIVDELLGKQQIVIKSLGEGLQNIKGVSGAAIMPDGQVGLIIDIEKLIETTRKPNPQSSSVSFTHNRS